MFYLVFQASNQMIYAFFKAERVICFELYSNLFRLMVLNCLKVVVFIIATLNQDVNRWKIKKIVWSFFKVDFIYCHLFTKL